MKTRKRIKDVRHRLYGLLGASLVAFTALASCSKEPTASESVIEGKDGLLTFVPEFATVSGAPQTMGLIDPNFTSKMVFDMGLFICDNNAVYPSSAYHPHAAGYFNMKGHCEANRVSAGDPATYKWTFTPSNTTIPYSEAGVRISGGATVDVYAYTPYTTGSIADPTHIPYTASQDDYMYTAPVMGVNSGSVNLQLKHAMTCFSFKIYTTRVGNAVLTGIKFTPKSNDFLVSSGTFDATTGAVNDRVYADETTPLVVPIKNPTTGSIGVTLPTNTPDETTFDVIVPPILDYADNAIELTLIFKNNGDPDTEYLTPVTIPASSATFEDGKHQFKRGYRYIYEVKIDNYTKFKPLGFEEWNTVPDQTVDVNI